MHRWLKVKLLNAWWINRPMNEQQKLIEKLYFNGCQGATFSCGKIVGGPTQPDISFTD